MVDDAWCDMAKAELLLLSPPSTMSEQIAPVIANNPKKRGNFRGNYIPRRVPDKRLLCVLRLSKSVNHEHIGGAVLIVWLVVVVKLCTRYSN